MRKWLRAKASRLHSLSQLLTKIEMGNFLIALSTSGLMALGVVPMSLSLLVALAVLFLLIGIVGRYVDAVKDDEQRLKKYEQHLGKCAGNGGEDSSNRVSDSSGADATFRGRDSPPPDAPTVKACVCLPLGEVV